MHPLIKHIGIALSALPAAATTTTLAAQPARQPNVLLILTDDQGWGDVRSHGNPRINTPTLDRLRSESVVVDRFFVSPMSAPTRASLLTGRYHLRTGVSHVSGGLENMRPEETTLAELYRDAGYATGCFGKWHNGAYFPYSPNGQGFGEFVGFCCGHWPNYFDPPLQRNEEMFRGKGYITDIITDEAIGFIERNRNQPFFCYVPFNAPHSPFMVPDKYYDKYKDIEAPDERQQGMLASVYAMVECVDDNIGRLLMRLDELGLRENTIVIFMTDNGPTHVERYNGDMRGMKSSVREGGVRVPFYLRWPGTLTHRVIPGVAAHIDVLPTLMDLCGITDYQTHFPIDGLSFAAAVRGQGSTPDGRMIFTHRLSRKLQPVLGGLRTETHRLEVDDYGVELYDMVNDPSETKNLYDVKNPTHKGLYDAYTHWFNDASRGVVFITSVPVGYPEAREVRIPTPEGRLSGALKCYGFYNQNWVRHFRTPGDSLVLSLNVVATGVYDLYIEYAHTGNNPTSSVRIKTNEQVVSVQVPEFNSVQLSPAPRVDMGEAPEMSWSRLRVGEAKLTPGEHSLTLWAEGIPDINTLNIKTVILKSR